MREWPDDEIIDFVLGELAEPLASELEEDMKRSPRLTQRVTKFRNVTASMSSNIVGSEEENLDENQQDLIRNVADKNYGPPKVKINKGFISATVFATAAAIFLYVSVIPKETEYLEKAGVLKEGKSLEEDSWGTQESNNRSMPSSISSDMESKARKDKAEREILYADPETKIDPITIDGEELTVQQIRSVYEEELQNIQACYEASIANAPHLRGTLKAEIGIYPSGEVGSATFFGGNIRNEELRHCVITNIESWKFPETSLEDEINVKINFSFIRKIIRKEKAK